MGDDMFHYNTLMENLIIRYLFNQIKNKTSNNVLIVKVVCDTLLPHLKKAIDNMECPYCGRKFNTKSAIKNHLTRSSSRLIIKGGNGLRHAYAVPTNPCAENFMLEVKYATDIYVKFKKYIMTGGRRKELKPLREPKKKSIVAYKAFPIWLEINGLL